MTPESIQLSQEIEALQRRRDEVAALYGKKQNSALAMRLQALDEMIGNATYALELMCRGDSPRYRYERFPLI